MSILTDEQSANLAEYLEKNHLTSEQLFAALDDERRKATQKKYYDLLAEKAKKYEGKCFKGYAEDATMYYWVVSAEGFHDNQVSCFLFGTPPALELHKGVIDSMAEVVLAENTEPTCGAVDLNELDFAEEITKSEFDEAFRDWTEKVLDLVI